MTARSTHTPQPRRRHARRGRRAGRFALATALVATVTTVGADVSTDDVAEAASDTTARAIRFNDPSRIVLSDTGAPSGWVGMAPPQNGAVAGQGYFGHQTNRALAIDHYGYDPGFAPVGTPRLGMFELGQYGEIPVTGEILDIAVGTLAGFDPNSPAVAVLQTAGAGTSIAVFTPLADGMDHLHTTEFTTSVDAAVGIEIVGGLLIAAKRSGIIQYAVGSTSIAPAVTSPSPDEFDTPRDDIVAVARNRGVDDDTRFAVITRVDPSGCFDLVEGEVGQQVDFDGSDAFPFDGTAPIRFGCDAGAVNGDVDSVELTYAKLGPNYSDSIGGIPRPDKIHAMWAADITWKPGALQAGQPVTSQLETSSGNIYQCNNHVAAGAGFIAPEFVPGSANSPFIRVGCVGEIGPGGSGMIQSVELTGGFPDFSHPATVHQIPFSSDLGDGATATPRQVLVGFPCNELDRRLQTNTCRFFPTSHSFMVVSDTYHPAVGNGTSIISNRVDLSAGGVLLGTDANTWGQRLPAGMTFADVDLDLLRVVVELDPELQGCRAVPADRTVYDDQYRCEPEERMSQPIPRALLAAPPTVDGAQQGGYAPGFARSTTGGTGSTETSSTSATYTIDAAPSFLDLVEVGIEASYSQSVEATSSSFVSTTTTEGYGGSMDADVIVYNQTRNFVYTGTIVESSTGVGLGASTEIIQPYESIDTSAEWPTLQEQFPIEFGSGGTMRSSIDQVFRNQVGQPDTYLPVSVTQNPDQVVESYCIGSLDDNPPIEPGKLAISQNPLFAESDKLYPQGTKAILLSEWHQVTAGSSNVETAQLTIEQGSEYSYLQSRSVDVSVIGKVFDAGGEYSAGHTWGSGQTSSLSTGTSFIGGVGHLPHTSLADEGYFWRMVLCKKFVTTPDGQSLPVWVQTYQVRDYGGDGVEPQQAPDTLAPVDSAVVSDHPTLEFVGSQLETTYSVEVDAVGAADARRFDHVAPAQDTADPVSVAWPDAALLPGQLYRWQVTARDVLGREAAGSTGFFVTEGAPNPIVAVDGSTVSPVVGVGQTVRLTDAGDDGGSPITLREFKLNGAIVGSGASVDVVPPAAGVYLVEVTSTNAFGSSTARSTLFVAPVGQLDQYSTPEDTPFSVDAANGVRTNDSGGTSVQIGTVGTGGSATLRGDGSFDYTPDADRCGSVGFDYMIIDVVSAIDPTPVEIDVGCENDPPSATDGAFTGTEDLGVTAGAPGVLAGATDPDTVANGAPADDTITAVVVDDVTNGTLALNGDGSFTYVGAPDSCGSDSFTFAPHDDAGAVGATRTVALTITCVPDAPVAADASVATDEDVEVIGQLSATDPDGDAVTYALGATVTAGTALVETDGSFSYTPAPDDCGPESFTFTASDGNLTSAPATVSIDVRCANDAPLAADDVASTDEDLAVDIDVLANDGDIDSTTLSVTIATPPAHGTAIVSAPGVVQYTPEPDFTGVDQLRYTLVDDLGAAANATVTITVNGVDDAPLAVDDAHGVVVGGTLDIDAANGVLSNDVDVDGDSLSVSGNDAPAAGTLDLAVDGSFTFTSDTVGEVSVEYTITDGTSSDTGTLTIDVQPALVFVGDGPAPIIEFTVEPGAAGAIVDYEIPTSSAGEVTCLPPPGSFFPIGDTTVTCTATVAPGSAPQAMKTGDVPQRIAPQQATTTFVVRLIDEEPPVFVDQPAGVEVTAAGSIEVPYDLPAAVDNDPAGATVTCSPAPGSVFSVGTTTVTCTAIDPSGSTAIVSFPITVTPELAMELPATGSDLTHRMSIAAMWSALLGVAMVVGARRRAPAR